MTTWFQGSREATSQIPGIGLNTLGAMPEVVKTVPHLAFAVDDLDAALEDKEITPVGR